MKQHIPNILTSGNLLCGCVAVVMIFSNRMDMASYFIFLAAFFDLLDGLAARRFGGNSAYGKELDSLADMISFGFVPGAFMFELFRISLEGKMHPENFISHVIIYFPFIITVFSALRLAKFNTDTRQTNSFIGLPTPANTLFIVSLPLIIDQMPGKFDAIILNPFFIVFVSILLSYLLISEIPLFSLKFKSLSWNENNYQYILIGVSVLLFVFFSFAAIPLIIFLYIFLSVIYNTTKQNEIHR